MEFSSENISVGDWVIVDSESKGIPRKVQEGRVVALPSDKNGCYIDSPTYSHSRVAVYWNEILAAKQFCKSCNSRKVYHDSKERWICPFC